MISPQIFNFDKVLLTVNQSSQYSILKQNSDFQYPQKENSPTSLYEKWGLSIQAHGTLG